jgi:hypothetical protein
MGPLGRYSRALPKARHGCIAKISDLQLPLDFEAESPDKRFELNFPKWDDHFLQNPCPERLLAHLEHLMWRD